MHILDISTKQNSMNTIIKSKNNENMKNGIIPNF